MDVANIDLNRINFGDETNVQSVLLEIEDFIKRESTELEVCAFKYIEMLELLGIKLESKFPQDLMESAKGTFNVLTPVKGIFDTKLKKIDELNMGKTNLERLIKQVDDILDLNHCAETIKKHIQNKNYELAAALVNRYLKLDPRVLSDMLNKNDGSKVNDLEQSFLYLNKVKLYLQDIFRERCTELLKISGLGNKDSDLEVFQMFPLVDLKDEGLKHFVSYFKKQFGYKCFMNGLDVNTTNEAFKNKVGGLLQFYANLGRVAFNFLNLYYESSDFVYYLREVHESCLFQEFLAIDNFFKKVMDVEKLCVLVRKYDSSKSLSLIYKGVPISEALNCIDYLSIVFSYYSVYTNFLTVQLKNGEKLFSSTIAFSNKSKIELLLASTIHNEGIKDVLEKLESFYVELNNFLVSVSCFKALDIDSAEDINDNSQLPDDIFYILCSNLKKCSATNTESIVNSFLGVAQVFLENNLTNHLRRRLMDAPGMTLYYEMSTHIHDKVELKKNGYVREFLRDLNLLYASLEKFKVFITYIKNLEDHSNLFNLERNNTKFSLKFDKIADSWEQLKEEKITFLNKESLTKLLMEAVDSFLHKNKLIITEEDLVLQTSNRDFGSDILCRVQVVMATMEENLNRTVFEEIIENLSHIFVIRFCERVSRFQCNKFGTLLLDKIMRMISTKMSSYFNNTIFSGFRDGFIFFEIMGLSLKKFTSDDSLMILRCDINPYDIVTMLENRVDVSLTVKAQIRNALL